MALPEKDQGEGKLPYLGSKARNKSRWKKSDMGKSGSCRRESEVVNKTVPSRQFSLANAPPLGTKIN